MKHEEVSYTSR